MDYNQKIRAFLLQQGASEVGFSKIGETLKEVLPPEYPTALPLQYAVSIVVKLSDAVLDTITDKPTHAYFHHYRTVNSLLDRLALQTGLYIEQHGFHYFPIAASQSINGYQGMFPHKMAARLSGLGDIGKNALFLSKQYGPRVRLATVLTDMPFKQEAEPGGGCIGCGKCVSLCPAMAISGRAFDSQNPMQELVDRPACSDYMKRHFQKIGRGSVCGVCIQCCPVGKHTTESV